MGNYEVKFLIKAQMVIFNGKSYTLKQLEDKKNKTHTEIAILFKMYELFTNPLNN